MRALEDIKEHIPNGSESIALCNQKGDIVILSLDWFERDIDPDQICKKCKLRYKSLYGVKIPQERDDFGNEDLGIGDSNEKI